MENNDHKEHSNYSASAVSSSSPIRQGRISFNIYKSDQRPFFKDSLTNNNGTSKYEIIDNVKQWYRYLLSKWFKIILAGLICSAAGLIYALVKKPVYSAVTTFVLENTEGAGGGLAQYASLANMIGIDLPEGGGGIFEGDNIIDLYKSRTMIKKTLLSEINFNGKKQLLIDRYVDFNRLREKWEKETGMEDLQFKTYSSNSNRLRDSIVNETIRDINKNYLTVEKPDKKLSLIKVEVKARDEAFALNFNEQIVKNVNDFYVRTKTKKLLGNIGILQKKTDSVRTVMNSAIHSAASISDATPNLNPTRGGVQRAAPVQRSQFSAETNKTILGELIKNLEMSRIALLKETPLIQVIDEPEPPLDVKEIGILTGLLVGMLLGCFLMTVLVMVKRILIY